MFQALIDALRTPDLRNKILFTLGMILVFRFLAHVPLPGVNQDQLNALLQSSAFVNLLDLFSGGGLARFSIVALGVNPYINASIIMTLLNQTIPALERLSKEGEYGRNKINQYTRVLTVPLALLQGIGVAVFMQKQGVLNAFGPSDLATTLSILASLTAGTIILMWLGELISERGIGNGISFIIFAGIVGRLPNTVEQTLQVQQNALALGSIVVIAVLVIAAIIFIQEGQRRVPVQSAKRMRGTRMYSGGSTFIPLRVNSAGVIPIIFAISVMFLPTIIANYFNAAPPATWYYRAAHWVQGNFAPDTANVPMAVTYNGLYFLFTFGFTYFYTAITFDVNDVADNLKRYSSFIPGIRPGRPTADYLQAVMNRVTFVGACFLGFITVILPIATAKISGIPHQQMYLGGTAILIVVGVALDTMKQLQTQLVMRQYRGFIK